MLGGVRHGETQGGPVAIQVGNTEWPKWETVMSPDPVDAGGAGGPRPQRPADPAAARARRSGRHAEVRLRRGPADPGAGQRPRDRRPGRARPGGDATSSSRRTASPCSATSSSSARWPRPPTACCPPWTTWRVIDDDPVRCFDRERRRRDVRRGRVGPEGRRHPRRRGRGGGLGAAAGSRLARPLGPAAGRPAGRCADGHPGDQGRRGRRRLRPWPGPAAAWPTTRSCPAPTGSSGPHTGAGGTEGGMTTGEVLRVRAAMKPIATVPRALRTIDTATGEAAVAHHQRSDVCAVPAAGVVAEAMVALVLAEAALEKFGGDSVGETRRNHGVAAELLQRRLGEHQGHHRLRDHPGGRDRAHVGALVVGDRGLAGRGVDGAQGPRARWRSASWRRGRAAPRRCSSRPRCRRPGGWPGRCRRRRARSRRGPGCRGSGPG